MFYLGKLHVPDSVLLFLYHFYFKIIEFRRLDEICGCIYNEYLTRHRAQYRNKTTILYIYIMILMLILNVIIFF